MNIGEIIKTIRLKNNLTQEELANELYYSCQTISNWERNISTPPINILLNLCIKYDFPINNFLNKKNNNLKNIIINSSMYIIKNNLKLTIENVSNISGINIDTINNFLNNDNNITLFIIDDYDKKIEKDILRNIVQYDNPVEFVLNKLIYILDKHKKVISYFYTNDYISTLWSSYLKSKYYNILINNFQVNNLNDVQLFIDILINMLQNFFTKYSHENINSLRDWILRVFNKKIIDLI